MTNYLLRGGRVIDPSQNLDITPLDVLVEKGVISLIDQGIYRRATIRRRIKSGELEEINLRELVLCPGLIDMHTHLREPGYEYKETIGTGSKAAAAGGFTAVACMPNTNPINDNRAVTEFILRKAKSCGLSRIYPIAAITKGSLGESLSEFGDLKDAGAVAVSDDGRPVMNSAIMRLAMEYASSFGLSVISHCEDLNLSAGGLMNEGFTATELGFPGIPSVAEEIMVAREILLSQYTGVPIHLAHISTRGAVNLVREGKKRGIKVTAETAPHYFTLTEENLKEFDTNLKTNPPLRGREDLLAIKEALKDGTIDVIASDHAPHGRTDKEVEFTFAASGISGLETSLGLSLILVEEGILTLSQLIEKMSLAPARILGVPGGSLAIGSPADITIIDLKKKWQVDPLKFYSRGKNSPFAGYILKGKAVLTMVAGTITYNEIGKTT